MKRAPAGLLLLLLAGPALAQAPASQGGSSRSFNFRGDGLSRYEWNQDQPTFQEESRWRVQVRPRVEFGVSRLALGVGGEFNYSQDKNYEPPEGQTVLPIIRDNYKSLDARLDLAFLRFQPTSWVRIEGGRFEMPVAFTEMIWDRDLRPQGGAITFEARDDQGRPRFGLTGLWAQGSHVFDDGKATMWVGSVEGVFVSTPNARFAVTGSYIKYTDINELIPQIRRQNTRVEGLLVRDYDVIDLVVRGGGEGRLSTQIVFDYSWNVSADDSNQALWAALVLGSVKTARARLEYVFAKIDKDATLAAYNGDDFFWGTGWLGHRVDLGFRTSDNSSVHTVGEIARFKDSPNPAERDLWAKRIRIEARFEN